MNVSLSFALDFGEAGGERLPQRLPQRPTGDGPDRGFGGDAIRVGHDEAYDSLRGCGFADVEEPSRNEDLRCSWPGEYFAPRRKSFIADVPYGNYEVAVTFGGADEPVALSAKAGPGMLMLRDCAALPGRAGTESFAVHVADGRLMLAFSGAAGVVGVRIERAPRLPTLFLVGDSTAANQTSGQYPFAGWGQMLPHMLTSGVAVANCARSGRSSKSFIEESRWNEIVRKLRPADYVLVQFAHNDEKTGPGGTEPFTTYKQYLRRYIEDARRRSAIPMLATPVHRRFFDEAGRLTNTHGDYIAAMKQLAEEEGVPCLDLADRSKRYFEELGEEGTKPIFMWTEPGEYDGLPEGTKDNTHFSQRGAAEIARLAASCIRESGIEPLCRHVRPLDRPSSAP
ncbi:rhamnogalacturonan acetylesterase [Paenibacillus sp. GYB003]|uniref:rhamnogalacturonan acetylesterase n=1 Tax=Paenibacillus sp. GYB003 TaxID=2994392 RepID=UPI002F96B018